MAISNVRALNYEKYNITNNRFRELYYWCLQYHEWKDELKYNTNTVRSIEITDMPTSHNGSDATQKLAMRRAHLEKNCKLIETCAREADPDIYPYILKAVTEDGITYRYLYMVMGIPCGKKMYYARRRKFYWLLNQKKSS